MKLIVDTNIAFSSILTKSSKISEILLNSAGFFDFYTTNFLKDELEEHKLKIQKISGLSETEIEKIKAQIFKKITFINSHNIPDLTYLESEKVMSDVDIDDTEFYALSIFLDCLIWTGDKKMHNKLKKKGINKTILTDELWEIRDKLKK